MKITNQAGLPEPLVRAVSRHSHEHVPNTISVTSLIQPPQIRALTLKHDGELSEDAGDRIWALLGTLLHGVLERNAKGLKDTVTEEELSIEVLGWRVIGHYDLSEMVLDGELLSDWKLTSVWAVKEGVKPEWVSQLNIYAHLIRAAGRQVNQIQIVAIGRDWSKNKAKFDTSYPQQQVKVMAVPLWTPEETQEFIEARVRLHQEAEKGSWSDCTPEERWSRPTIYALMKKGQKKAVKLFETRAAADFATAKDQYIVERPGESVRCESYCAVSGVCPQLKREKEAKSLLKQLENSVELLQNQEKEKQNANPS